MARNTHQQQEQYAAVNRLCVDVRRMAHSDQDDSNQQSHARQQTEEKPKKLIRQSRFTVEEPKLDRNVLLSHDPYRSFIQNSHFTIHSDEDITPTLIEKAARGIELEGAKLNLIQEANNIASELRKVKHKSKKEILECCVKLYTAETFLYRLINKVMREATMCKGMFHTPEDVEYGENLGPYCALLEKYLCDNPNPSKITVYRCAKIKEDVIEDYQRNIGRLVWFDAFSSTTKNKKVAMGFHGNALFVIHINTDHRFGERSGVDISALSEYGDEEEILLHPAIQVTIKSVDYDSKVDKYIITLTLGNDFNNL